MRRSILAVALLCLAVPAFAQDPLVVDPSEHTLLLENENVRVLEIHHRVKETTPLHDHPAAVAIFLTDGNYRVSAAGQAARDVVRKRGDVAVAAAAKHTVENRGTRSGDMILVELRNPPVKDWQPPARDA